MRDSVLGRRPGSIRLSLLQVETETRIAEMCLVRANCWADSGARGVKAAADRETETRILGPQEAHRVAS